MKDIERAMAGVILLLLLFLVLIALTFSAIFSSDKIVMSETGDRVILESGLEYTILEIEGMPCINYEQSYGSDRGYSGLTCDWSRWQGPSE